MMANTRRVKATNMGTDAMFSGGNLLKLFILVCLTMRAEADQLDDDKLIQQRLAASARSNKSREFMNRLLDNMDPRLRPITQDGSAIEVQCGFYIVSFSSINELSMDYKMSILFREKWRDTRLMYKKGPDVLSLNSLGESKIWVPDIYFPNEKDAKFHSITVPNSMMKIYPNGTVVHSVRITLQLSCPMDLASFPMDSQVCSIKLESFAYESNQLFLNWMETPVEIDNDLELPQFDIGDEIQTSNCTKRYKTTGSFSCLKADFTLYRQFGFFLLQTYIPSMLIVILSWLSFWINMDAVPARISLGVTTVLTMTTQLSGSTSSIPKVSYPKAIDVWLSVCMMFVFASLIEYAFVNALSRKYTKEKYKNAEDEDEETDEQHQTSRQKETSRARRVVSGLMSISLVKKCTNCNQRSVARSIDKVSRVLFPTVFLLFNIVYWPAYKLRQ